MTDGEFSGWPLFVYICRGVYGVGAMKEKEPISMLERIAIRMTESVGSVTSLVVHSILFVLIFGLYFFGVGLSTILLILTTAVSLEAIYLAIFIQMTVNRNTQSLEAVEEDIDEIQEDVQEIEHDIDEIQVDVDEIQVDVDEMHTEVEELEKDVDEIQKDVDEIAVDLDEDDVAEEKDRASLTEIQQALQKIMLEIEALKKNKE